MHVEEPFKGTRGGIFALYEWTRSQLKCMVKMWLAVRRYNNLECVVMRYDSRFILINTSIHNHQLSCLR